MGSIISFGSDPGDSHWMKTDYFELLLHQMMANTSECHPLRDTVDSASAVGGLDFEGLESPLRKTAFMLLCNAVVLELLNFKVQEDGKDYLDAEAYHTSLRELQELICRLRNVGILEVLLGERVDLPWNCGN